jgi:D-glycero-D-manno-heptose 1,7-bisphosphate phosphatase
MALRLVENASRYGNVQLHDNQVTHFGGKEGSSGPAFVNGGVYVLDRRIVDHLRPECSFELDVLSGLAAAGHKKNLRRFLHRYRDSGGL